jgi:hypothetical protein
MLLPAWFTNNESLISQTSDGKQFITQRYEHEKGFDSKECKVCCMQALDYAPCFSPFL